MKELDGKTIRFIAVDKRYMRSLYPAIAPHSKEMGTYITGQHINPLDEDSLTNLSDSEMLGEVEIKPNARKIKFPYVINPDNPVYIEHMKKYNCKRSSAGRPMNPRDYAEAHFIMLQDIVSPDKKSVKPGKHYFFLEDKEADAKSSVIERDYKYEAQKFIRETLTVEQHIDIINLMNLKHPYFRENIGTLSAVRMFEVLLRTAEEHPKDIIFMKSKGAKDELFISKLVGKKILSKRVDGFYEGRSFIARTLGELVVVLHSEKGEKLIEKWGLILNEED